MQTLEKKIRELNREILALKTSQPLVAGMRTFWAQYIFELEALVPDPYDPPIHTTYYYEITYSSGSQPILTDIGSSIDMDPDSGVWLGMAVLESPKDNKQILAIWSTGYGDTVAFWFCSTRQILGVRKINPPN